MYFWFPKVTGRMYHEGVGKLSFWMTFVGTSVTFFPMHIVGLLGMPRRNYTYPPGMGWTFWNLLDRPLCKRLPERPADESLADWPVKVGRQLGRPARLKAAELDSCQRTSYV